MRRGLLALASALVVATTMGATSAKADPPWMRGPGYGPPGHHYGWRGHAVPPGWYHGRAWWKPYHAYGPRFVRPGHRYGWYAHRHHGWRY